MTATLLLSEAPSGQEPGQGVHARKDLGPFNARRSLRPGSGSVCVRAFDSNPFEGLSPVGECTHLNGFAVAEGKDIGQAGLVPFGAVFGPGSRMNKHNDLVAGDNGSLVLAA